MVLHPNSIGKLPSAGKLGVGVAYLMSLIAGTAFLIAVFPGSAETHTDGARVDAKTYAESVMQSATERALVSPQSAVLAGAPETNDKRGL